MSVWSLPKLRDYLVQQKIVAAISVERLGQILNDRKIRWRHTKTGSSRPIRISGPNTAESAAFTNPAGRWEVGD